MYFGWYVGPSTTGPHGGIGQIDTATGKVTLADLGGYQPSSVTFAPDGGLWFVDPGLNQVDRVTVAQLFPNGSTAPAPKLSLKVPASGSPRSAPSAR